MVNPKEKPALANDPERSPMAELVRDLGGLPTTAEPPLPEVLPRGLAEVELALADLLSDENGEIVFFNDSGFRTLAIETSAAVVADGQAAPHVTAGGEDVTGFHFLTFDNGITLYYDEGLTVLLPDA
jgi:hypothetical protein